MLLLAFLDVSVVESACHCRRQRKSGLIPGLGRSPGGGHSNHSSMLAWGIPWAEEPRVLQSMGHKEVDTSKHTHLCCF